MRHEDDAAAAADARRVPRPVPRARAGAPRPRLRQRPPAGPAAHAPHRGEVTHLHT